ncbi:hypothetical protein ACMFMG_011132 [Clarireedia jacksonii]
MRNIIHPNKENQDTCQFSALVLKFSATCWRPRWARAGLRTYPQGILFLQKKTFTSMEPSESPVQISKYGRTLLWLAPQFAYTDNLYRESASTEQWLCYW